jgi:membrane protease YdiL (CAAX protease family)
MPAPEPKLGDRNRPLIEAFAASFGIWVFALFIHSGLPTVLLAAAGLIITAAALIHSLHAEDWSPEIWGISSFAANAAAYLIAGCAIGTTFGLYYRFSSDIGAFPARIGSFVIFAALIGAAEEVLFRGYVQGRLRCLTPIAAVVLASAAHTIYKSALFILPPDNSVLGGDFKTFVILTFFGGAVFGVLRELSGSVLPPLIAHALFDVLVYGERSTAPWWVWS